MVDRWLNNDRLDFGESLINAVEMSTMDIQAMQSMDWLFKKERIYLLAQFWQQVCTCLFVWRVRAKGVIIIKSVRARNCIGTSIEYLSQIEKKKSPIVLISRYFRSLN